MNHAMNLDEPDHGPYEPIIEPLDPAFLRYPMLPVKA